MKKLILLLAISLPVIGFSQPVAKPVHPVNVAPLSQAEQREHCHEKVLGIELKEIESTYESLKDKQVYKIVDEEKGTFKLYMKGFLDKEGIENNSLVLTIIPLSEIQ